MRVRPPTLIFLASAAALIGCAPPPPPPPPPKPVVPPAPTDTVKVPLTDLGTGTYYGHVGGLYPGGANFPPPDHDSVARARRNQIQALDVNGDESPFGKYVLLAIGSTNTTQEWCSASSAPPCSSWTFMGRAAADPLVNHYALVIVNGAAPDQGAPDWTSATSPNYDRIKVGRLAPLGLSENQVQAVWLDLSDPKPVGSLPTDSADANALLTNLGQIMRALRARYPYLRLVFVSSPIYGGYPLANLSREPFAYESGFSVKWLIESQINEMKGQPGNPRAGTLDYVKKAAPLILWGPYLWTAGDTPRSDGLAWLRSDFETDAVHLSKAGETKAAEKLLDFFKTSTYTRCWFVNGGTCY
ncbi:MAG TPA: hypothetical protein VHL32_02525 [Gemmatimonadaceae bacterium]|jgi:hypothetical protein|nr:hypothetical protein [Gemmatimonadaceae bacterium]